MTRPFDPRDVVRVRGLQRLGCSLDLEGDVLVGRSPLHSALASLIPLGRAKVVTLVEPGGVRATGNGGAGLVQFRPRRDAGGADVTFLAPGPLDAGASAWPRLLAEAGRQAGVQGTLRLHAAAPAGDRRAVALLRQAGFVPGGNDLVMRREGHLDGRGQRPAPWRPDAASETAGPVGGWWPAVAGGGAWRLYLGRRASWLTITNFDGVDLPRVLAVALAECSAHAPDAPVLCAIPPDSDRAEHTLEDAGFTPLTRRVHLVRPTAARVLEPAWAASGPDRALRPARRPTTGCAAAPGECSPAPPEAAAA